MTTTPLVALQDNCASALQPGEEFLAAIHVQAPDYNNASRDAMLGITVGTIMALHDRKKAAHTTDIPLTSAGALVGVTSDRILVFNVGIGLHPKELLGAVERVGVTLQTEEFRQGLVKHLHFGLFNGDRMIVNAVCSQKNPDLDAFRELIPAAVPA